TLRLLGASRARHAELLPNWPMLSAKLQMTRYSASITLPHTSTGSGAPPPTLDQDRRHAHVALHIVLDTITVFPRRKLRGHPFHCVHAQPRALNVLVIQDQRAVFLLDVIARRILGDLGDALEQQISALFSRARTCQKSPRAIGSSAP